MNGELVNYWGKFNSEDFYLSNYCDLLEFKAVKFYKRFADSRWVDFEVSRAVMEKFPEPHRFDGWGDK
jgi:hypothetical protein